MTNKIIELSIIKFSTSSHNSNDYNSITLKVFPITTIQEIKQRLNKEHKLPHEGDLVLYYHDNKLESKYSLSQYFDFSKDSKLTLMLDIAYKIQQANMKMFEIKVYLKQDNQVDSIEIILKFVNTALISDLANTIIKNFNIKKGQFKFYSHKNRLLQYNCYIKDYFDLNIERPIIENTLILTSEPITADNSSNNKKDNLIQSILEKYEEKDFREEITEDELHIPLADFLLDQELDRKVKEKKQLDFYDQCFRMAEEGEESDYNLIYDKMSERIKSISENILSNDFLYKFEDYKNSFSKKLENEESRIFHSLKNISNIEINDNPNEEVDFINNSITLIPEEDTLVEDEILQINDTDICLDDYFENAITELSMNFQENNLKNLSFESSLKLINVINELPIKEEKLINIILDLDNTIIHSIPLSASNYNNEKKITQPRNTHLFSFTYNNKNQYFKTLYREEFIDLLLKYKNYIDNVYISTAAIEEYANIIKNNLIIKYFKDLINIKEIVSSKVTIINKVVNNEQKVEHNKCYTQFNDYKNSNLKNYTFIFDDTIYAWPENKSRVMLLHSQKFLAPDCDRDKIYSGLLLNSNNNVLIEYPNKREMIENYRNNNFKKMSVIPPNYEIYGSPSHQVKAWDELFMMTIKCLQSKGSMRTCDILDFKRRSTFMGLYICINFIERNEIGSYLYSMICDYGGKVVDYKNDLVTHILFNNGNYNVVKENCENIKRRLNTEDVFAVNENWIIKSIYCLKRLDESFHEFCQI